MEEDSIVVEQTKVRIIDKLLSDISYVLISGDKEKIAMKKEVINSVISTINTYIEAYSGNRLIVALLQKQKSYLSSMMKAIDRKDVNAIRINADIFKQASNDLIKLYRQQIRKAA